MLPEGVVPVALAILTLLVGLLGWVARNAIAGAKADNAELKRHVEEQAECVRILRDVQIQELRDQVRSHDQELYGAKANNGMKAFIREIDDEVRYQGAVNHWTASLVTVISEKSGVVIRNDRPKRNEQR